MIPRSLRANATSHTTSRTLRQGRIGQLLVALRDHIIRKAGEEVGKPIQSATISGANDGACSAPSNRACRICHCAAESSSSKDVTSPATSDAIGTPCRPLGAERNRFLRPPRSVGRSRRGTSSDVGTLRPTSRCSLSKRKSECDGEASSRYCGRESQFYRRSRLRTLQASRPRVRPNSCCSSRSPC
jgi:hypothetical protein